MVMDSAEDLELLARQVPAHLILLRKVHREEPQNTRRGQAYERMRDEKPEKFTMLLNKAENDWRLTIAALEAPGRNGSNLTRASNLVDDEGLARAKGACREWLKGRLDHGVQADADKPGGLEAGVKQGDIAREGGADLRVVDGALGDGGVGEDGDRPSEEGA